MPAPETPPPAFGMPPSATESTTTTLTQPRTGRHSRPAGEPPAFYIAPKPGVDGDADQSDRTSWAASGASAVPDSYGPPPGGSAYAGPPAVQNAYPPGSASGYLSAPNPYGAPESLPLYPPPPGPPPAGAYAGPPRPARRLHPGLGLVLVLALLGGGAYGGKLYLDRGSSHSSTAATGTPKTASELAAYTVRPGDLASTWVAQPADDSDQSDSSSGDDSSDPFATCLGLSSADASIQSAAESDAPDYDSPTGDISSSASSFASSSLTSRIVSDLTKAGAADCFKADLTAGTSDATITADNVTASLTGHQAGQPANVIATLQESFTATAASTGAAVPGFITAVFLGHGTVLSTVVFTGIGQPVDSATQASIVAKLSDRLG